MRVLVSLLAMSLWFEVAGAQTSPQAVAPMEVVFLGTGGPRPAGRAASCNLILIQGKARLLVDAGSGAFTRLGELQINLSSLDIILLTHLHIDHTADVSSLARLNNTPIIQRASEWSVEARFTP